MSRPWGIYVHVPFCRTRCRYCDFYRVGESSRRQRNFLRALHREIEGADTLPARADSIFFGGGTPSLLSPVEVAEVLEHLAARVTLADAEITLEANPSDLDSGRLAGLRAAGVNRLSIGVQSLADRELGLLGRRHDAAGALRVVRQARAAGFERLSLDLMLGVPGQTEASFRRTLEVALETAPDHLSLYILEVHSRSEMDFLRRKRPGLFPGEEVQRRRYLRAVERLEAAGLVRYEISNFARPGQRSRHNLKYWACEPVLGLGPAAHSTDGRRRWRHPPDLQAYLADPLATESVPSHRGQERVFMGLRLAQGMGIGEVAKALGISETTLVRRVEPLAPYLEITSDRLRLTLEGVLVSTSVLAELLTPEAA